MTQVQSTCCPVCGGEQRAPVTTITAVRLLRCLDCDAVHAGAYDDPTEVYRAGYHSGQTGYHLDTTSEPFQAYLRQVNAQRMSRLAALRRPGTLLDIGCGTGEFLVAARDAGWQVAGIEPVADAVATAAGAGLDVHHGMLDDHQPTTTYDVVTAMHVVEHVPDVATTLRRLLALVAPGGYLVVEVPNWQGLNRWRTRERWPLLGPGEHLTHFTPKVLTSAIRSAGGVPIMTRTPSWTGPPQSTEQSWLDLGLPAAPGLVRRLSRGDGPTRTGRQLLDAIDGVWARIGVGMVIWAVAARPPAAGMHGR